jgi:hypothetical protein
MNLNLVENNYLVKRNFIEISEAERLEREFKLYCDQNDHVVPDEQVPNSPACYNYISFLELLCEKTSEVSKVVGEKVLPTCSYSRLYKKGAMLEEHMDRDSCEISLTINLGGDKEWPFWIEKPSGEKISIILFPGDAIIYLGHFAYHWREVYEGENYTQVFLHYVRSRGERNYLYFDKDNKDFSF